MGKKIKITIPQHVLDECQDIESDPELLKELKMIQKMTFKELVQAKIIVFVKDNS